MAPFLISAVLLLAQAPPPSEADVIRALKERSVPLKTVVAGNGFADMEPLRKVLSGVEIVGMGESTHGSREIFQMKHRMFEFLVERMGYTVFALESSMPDTVAMDRYVATGEGELEKAVRAQGFWTWSTEEVADLLRWMRRYNENPKHTRKLRVVGVDMQNRSGAAAFLKREIKGHEAFFGRISAGKLTEADLQELAKVVKAAAASAGTERAALLDRVSVVLRQAANEEGVRVVREARAKVAGHLIDTVKGAEKLLADSPDIPAEAKAGLDILVKSSKTVYEPTPEELANMGEYSESLWGYAGTRPQEKRAAYVRAADVLDYFDLAHQYPNAMKEPNHRDRCMADNTEWIFKTYLPGQKIMYWGHNFHVSNFRVGETLLAQGAHLAERFGDKYYPVGFAFNQGGFQAIGAEGGLKEWTVRPAKEGSLDALLDKIGRPMFFINFAALDSPSKAWLEEARPTRSIGALYNPAQEEAFYQSSPVAKLYRGLIFISKTERARPLGGSR